jgi:hypothetical protein
MSPKLKFYFKLFAIVFPIMAITDLGLNYLFDDEWLSGKDLVSAVTYGIFIAGGLGYLHIREVKKLGFILNEDAFSVHQKAVFPSILTSTEIMEKLKADPEIAKWKLREEPDQVYLLAESTWKSIGETISLRVEKHSGELNRIVIESKPANAFTLLDYGKNRQNIIRLHRLLAA